MDEQIPTLTAVLAEVLDPRAARGRPHPWSALLLVIVAGLLSGAYSQRALARWSRDAGLARRRRLGLARRRGPSQPTLQRVLRRIDVAVLERVLGRWLQQVRGAWLASTARWLDGIAVSLLHRWRGRDVTAARQFFAGHPAALLRRLSGLPRRL